jgi:hypothetical protein
MAKDEVILLCIIKNMEGKMYCGYYGTIHLCHLYTLMDIKHLVLIRHRDPKETIFHVMGGLIKGFVIHFYYNQGR